VIEVGKDDAPLQHICDDKYLTTVVIIFTLLFEAILGFSEIGI
jgi:hypothetical protein